ncbi:MAG: hypothetical protein LBK50_03370 [Candidatus Nomurabacteria bacterium]|jgi:hypothetical protein|nr:hypothetical protein [Candidatus Nomurabacteria bacterium]
MSKNTKNSKSNKASNRTQRERERERESRFGPTSLSRLSKRAGQVVSHKAWFIITALLVGAAFIVGISIGNSAEGSAPSGTSIPVKKGGTGATDKTNALKNLLPDLAGNDGKVLGLSSGTPTWMNSATLPNYSAADSGKILKIDNSGSLTWATPPTTTYPTTEQSTGETWIDGKPIYRRTFTGEIVAGANARVYKTLLAAGVVDTLIDSEGWVGIPESAAGTNGWKTQVNTSVSYDTSISGFSAVYVGGLGDLGINSQSQFERKTGQTYSRYEVTVYYTKK